MPSFFPIDDLLNGLSVLPRATPPTPPQTTVIALIMGHTDTQPALCAVRYSQVLLSPGDPLFGELPIHETHYTLLSADRLPAKLSYPQVAATVNRAARRLYDRNSRGDYHALVDASGVGRPVVDAIRDSIIPQCHVTAVSIGPGDAGDLAILWRHETSVGLAYLISRLQAILHGGRLHVPESPKTTGLLDLLRGYDLKSPPSVDLVRALALACASEEQTVRYGPSPDSLPSPRL